MDKIERDRLRALCEAATAGPWYFGDFDKTGLGVMVANIEDEDEPLLISLHLSQEQVDANWDFCAEARTAIPAMLDALDEAEAKEARLAEHLLRTQQACAIFERNSADVAEMWDRVKAAEGVRDDLRAKLDAAEAIITKHNLCHDLHGRVGRAEFHE